MPKSTIEIDEAVAYIKIIEDWARGRAECAKAATPAHGSIYKAKQEAYSACETRIGMLRMQISKLRTRIPK